MKKWKKLLGIFMSGAMLLTGGVLPQNNAVTAEEAADYGISSPRIENGVTTWDKIKFGSYYQDAEIQPEPIKWRVLSVNGDDAFLLADQILDAKPYNEKWEDVTWETCTLRKWLNDDFYNEAFTDEEKEVIRDTTVINENNPYYNTDGGNDTTDKVYLLSIAEASDSAYGFDTEFGEKSKTREAKNTDYAKLSGAYDGAYGTEYEITGNGDWWLRSPGRDSDDAAYVSGSSGGYGMERGGYVSDNDHGVRPALHINLSSSNVKDAGEVDSEGNVTKLDNGINSPVVNDGVTTWDCVYFGNYRKCTFKKQDIEWRVLSVNGNDAFLLADKILDAKPYNDGYKNVIWNRCTLRKWLNEDFYNEAFNEKEKKAVKETMVDNVNLDNLRYDTEDKVYLLSIAEASNVAYGFDLRLTTMDEIQFYTRQGKNTDYAKVNGVDTITEMLWSDYDESIIGNGNWWLRSPGDSSKYAAGVDWIGHVEDGSPVDSVRIGVRPALHIDLSSSTWSKAGQINSNGEIMESTPSPEPTPTNTPTASPTPIPTNKPTGKPTDYGINNPKIEDGVTTWDKIKFGSYYQDADEVQIEPIKWRVLSVNGDDAFLLADEILDVKQYWDQGGSYPTTWKTSTLRTWLNEDFYNEAFDSDEKKAVKETTVINEDNPYGTEGGEDTQDKVYLLSRTEASNAAYGFDTEFVKNSKTREAKNTDYAKLNGAYTSTDDTFGASAGNGSWWLRSPALSSYGVSYVNDNGHGNDYGTPNNGNEGVRPALHINLLSSKVTYAGKVDSAGNVTMSGDGIHNPTVEDGVTTWDCIYFGNYRQNCKFEKQDDIEWRVLSVDGDDAFLLADKILDAAPYNEKGEDVIWETCTLRKWLNEDFYNEAFDNEEKEAISKTTVINEDNLKYGTEGGNDTQDKVYLLSIAEACSEDYGFDTEFNEKSNTRETKNTDYAKVNGANTSTGGVFEGSAGNGSWWLRSPGAVSSGASEVGNNGYGYDNSFVVNNGSTGVRPVLHINLSSSVWSKAGQINSDGEAIEPTPSPKPTQEPSQTDEPTKEPSPTDKPTASPELEPTTTAEPTKEPSLTDKPVQTSPPTSGIQPTPPSVGIPNPVQTANPVLKKLKLSSVKCAKNAKKITGKVSVSKASVKIKVGKKAYKKAAVKGKKFTLKLKYKLKKKTKVIIKAEKKGYKSVVKSYTVK